MRQFICKVFKIPTITSREGADALNVLVGYCVQRGMKEGNYSSDELLDEMKPYIKKLGEYWSAAEDLKERYNK